MKDPLAGKCSLVSSPELMFSTWAGAEVQHTPGCDGKCEVQKRLDASARVRQQSFESAMRNINGEDE